MVIIRSCFMLFATALCVRMRMRSRGNSSERAAIEQEPWQCHHYSTGQDGAWCESAGVQDGWEYKFAQGDGTCDPCWCCKREVSAGTTICDEASWPDNEKTCGECKILVDRFDSVHRTCSSFCATVGRQCVAAWEEVEEDCNVLYDMTCDQTIASSDALCQCGDELPYSKACFDDLGSIAVDEGGELAEVDTSSAETCKQACFLNSACESFAHCPQWGKCWLKDRSFSGGEPTRVNGECKTHYKKSCGGGSAPTPTSAPTPAPTTVPPSPSPPGEGPTIRIVSYNLFWWNAFGQNPWKSDGIVSNIQYTLKPDSLGMQECDDPGEIQSRAGGYYAASEFQGGQGVSVRPGMFTVETAGSRDLQATGYWGPRFVTWTKLRHIASGRSFWHFNTHWCVQDCDANKRYTGAQNMLNAIRESVGSNLDEPVVITGDFNAFGGQGEPGIQHFLQNGFSLAEWNWVDAVFYSTAHWSKVGSWVGEQAGSDHNPLVADLQLL